MVADYTGAEMGEILRRARERRGWSQAELATHLGVKQQSVSKWESGDARPRSEVLGQILAALTFEEDELAVVRGAYYPGPGVEPSSEPSRERVHEDDVEWEFATSAEISEATRRAMLELLRDEAERTGRVEIIITRRDDRSA